jgi:hypothetical protein
LHLVLAVGFFFGVISTVRRSLGATSANQNISERLIRESGAFGEPAKRGACTLPDLAAHPAFVERVLRAYVNPS